MAKKRKINLLYDATSMAIHLKNGTGTGIYTVSYNILKELCRRKCFQVMLYCEEAQLNNLLQGLKRDNSDIKKLKVFTENDYSRFDVFFSPKDAIPHIIRNQTSIKKYVFLHDAIPILNYDYSKDNCTDWFFNMYGCLNYNDFYFVNSEQTQRDFMEYNHIVTKDNSTVTYLACDKQFKPNKSDIKKVLKKYQLPLDKKYIFSLCTLEPRKNLIRGIKTFVEFIDKNQIEDMVFILGGGAWKTFKKQFDQELEGLGKYKNKILPIGYVDDCDLPTLYSGAEWFVYTSQYEGFGLPPLEAMACGCPVITSNNSSLPEVVGDAGIMIDWDSDEQHIKAYEKYYFDKKFRDEMAKKSLDRSKQFSWKKTVDVIEQTILSRHKNNNENNVEIIEHSKINLLYDANLLAQGLSKGCDRSGVFFVVYNLLKNLITQKDINIYLYVSKEKLKDTKTFISADAELKDLTIAVKADYSQMDAFLSLHADIPDIILKYGNIRTYKMVYDFMGCIFPDGIFSTKLVNHQRAVFCNKLFCISESTKRDYLKFVPEVDTQKLIVAPLGANQNFYPRNKTETTALKKRLDIPKKYILSVCNLAPHKNLFTAIDAFIDFIKQNDIKDLSYVLVGSCPEHFRADWDKKMESLGEYKRYIILTGYLPDMDLPTLYSGAEWFVFPSLYEGFGLPILEAMQCGCPVVCSNTSSMPEVLGDCGLLVSPAEKNEFVEAYKKMYKSSNFRKKCTSAGRGRTKLFSWDNMANIISQEIKKDFEQNNNQAEYPIVLITDENYVTPTIVTITSILANKYYNTKYRIYVLGNSLSKKSKDLFSQIPDVSLINLHKVFSDFEGTHGHVSAAALLKFKLAEMFPQYDKMLYLDTDMIIQKDLSELFNVQLGNKYAAVVKDMKGMEHFACHMRLQLKAYFNSGMMLSNLEKMRQDNISEKLIDYKKNKDVKNFMDQDCLNVVFNENVIYLPCTYNYMPGNLLSYSNEKIADFYGIAENLIPDFNKYAYIIHLSDKRKPWKYKSVFGVDLWARYYYMSPLKNKKIQYINAETEKRGIFGIPLFGTLRAVKKNGNLKIKKYFLGIPYFYKEKAAYKKIYHIFGAEFTSWKKLLNKDIHFAKQLNTSSDISGLSRAEKWGRWSCANEVEMMFKLPINKGDLKFSFNLKAYVNERHTQQKVSVLVNDAFMAEWNFEYKKTMPKTEFVLPQKILKKSGKTFLCFKIQNPVSPRDLGLAADGRKLGIGFISMQITPTVVKETKLQKWWKKLKANRQHTPSVDYSPVLRALSKEIADLKGEIKNLQKEVKSLKNEQVTTQKMLVNEKTLLQKKRRLKQ